MERFNKKGEGFTIRPYWNESQLGSMSIDALGLCEGTGCAVWLSLT